MNGTISSGIRHNTNDTDEEPVEVSLPTGWLAKRCWASDLYCNLWVLAEKGREKKTFSLGQNEDLVGAADQVAAPKWRNPAFPEGTYMAEIWSEGSVAYGLD